jgi:hypothetical protein
MREPGVTSWLRVAVMALSAVLVSACGDRRQENATVHDGIEFGIWIPDDRGQLHFERTLEVPYVAEQAFGWRLEDVVPEAPVHWVERLELPRPPESWEGVLESANVEISEDGRTATTFGTSMPGDEFVGNVWFVSPGDPMGDCRITVEFEDGRKATFRFRIVVPADGRPPAGGGEIV